MEYPMKFFLIISLVIAFSAQANEQLQGCKMGVNANPHDMEELSKSLTDKGYVLDSKDFQGLSSDFVLLADVQCAPASARYCEGWLSIKHVATGRKFSGSAESKSPNGVIKLLKKGLKQLPDCKNF